MGRRGKKKALIAVGHKILIAAYFVLRDKVAYKDLGGDYLVQMTRERQIKRHLQHLKELGVNVEIKEVA